MQGVLGERRAGPLVGLVALYDAHRRRTRTRVTECSSTRVLRVPEYEYHGIIQEQIAFFVPLYGFPDF